MHNRLFISHNISDFFLKNSVHSRRTHRTQNPTGNQTNYKQHNSEKGSERISIEFKPLKGSVSVIRDTQFEIVITKLPSETNGIYMPEW